MIDLLTEPMSYEFMRRALLVVTASGVAGALLRSFVPDPRGAQCTYDIGLHDPAWNVVREYVS